MPRATLPRSVILSAVLGLLLTGPVRVFASPAGPVIALHARPAVPGNACQRPPSVPCSQYDVEASAGVAIEAYVVVAGVPAADGVQEATFQISYDPAPGAGIDVLGWQLCADFEAPVPNYLGAWPGSGSGNRIVWSPVNCQRGDIPPDGVHAVAGVLYLYAYSDDALGLAAASIPGFSAPTVRTCDGVQHGLPSSRTAALGLRAHGGGGCNPCLGPCPEVDFFPCQVSTTQLDFGEVPLGTSKDLGIVVTNISAASLTVSIPDTCREFEIVSPALPFTLAYGEAEPVTVRFAPQALGLRTCILYPCAWSVFAWGTAVEATPARLTTWGGIKAIHR